MSERNLSRRLSTSIVDALKARGHILVARGGATALARELEEKMSDDIETIAPRLDPWGLVDGEVTTTFGADEVDDQVEELVATLTTTLVESEHVEDVFAEDNVIKRDVFRVMRDALLGPRRGLIYDDDGPVQVRLDTLGYVASTVGKRAPVRALREALARAAQSAGGKLTEYDPESREATFTIAGNDPDARLELEEAVADELTDLVNANVVTLPSVERRIELPYRIDPGSKSALRQRLDALAAKMLRQGGCAATWELDGDRTLKLQVTPLSEKDALDVDDHVSALAREIGAALDEAQRSGALGMAGAARPRAPQREPIAEKNGSEEEEDDELEDEDDELDEDEDEDDELTDEAPARAKPGAKAEPERAKPAKKVAAKAAKKAAAPAKKAAPKKAPAPSKKIAASSTKKAPAEKPTAATKKAATAGSKKTAAAPAKKTAAAPAKKVPEKKR